MTPRRSPALGVKDDVGAVRSIVGCATRTRLGDLAPMRHPFAEPREAYDQDATGDRSLAPTADLFSDQGIGRCSIVCLERPRRGRGDVSTFRRSPARCAAGISEGPLWISHTVTHGGFIETA